MTRTARLAWCLPAVVLSLLPARAAAGPYIDWGYRPPCDCPGGGYSPWRYWAPTVYKYYTFKHRPPTQYICPPGSWVTVPPGTIPDVVTTRDAVLDRPRNSASSEKPQSAPETLPEPTPER